MVESAYRQHSNRKKPNTRPVFSSGTAANVFSPLEITSLTAKRVKRQRRSFGNIFLLLVEIGAVVGVVLLISRSLLNWQAVRQAPAAVAGIPTVVALTKSESVELLPGDHQAPTSNTTVPQPLQRLVQQPLPAVALPTAAPGLPSRLVIKKINIEAPVIEGDGSEQLKMGIGHRISSASPGQRGNMVLSGHNDIYGELFRDLDKLAIGDEVIIYSGIESFRYVVREKRIVSPNDVSVLQSSQTPIVTLITCYPYLVDTHRLVVVAELEK